MTERDGTPLPWTGRRVEPVYAGPRIAWNRSPTYDVIGRQPQEPEMVTQHTNPSSTAMAKAQKDADHRHGEEQAQSLPDERVRLNAMGGPQPSPSVARQVTPQRGTPADPGPGGPDHPGGQGADGLPAAVNPDDAEARRDIADKQAQKLAQAEGSGRAPHEMPSWLTAGNVERAAQYIRSAKTEIDRDSAPAAQRAQRLLDNALTELNA